MLRLMSAYVCAWYWVGVASGTFFAQAPWSNWNPDTFIHGAMPFLTIALLAEAFKRKASKEKESAK